MEIEKLICEAVAALPAKAREAMNNVVFVVEDEARRKKESEESIERNEVLLGLYEGIPKTERGSGYFGVLPDKITIFQKPLEELSRGNKNELKQLVFEVIWHEVGHHLGFDEKEICELEEKKKKNLEK